MGSAHASLLVAAHPATATAPPPSHDGLYATCATLIIAVLVVLYFDERVRRGLTARTRGRAIGYLGGIIAVGILNPLLALAGIISDTAPVRWFTVLYTLAFLVFAFGIAIQKWGYEDRARIRAAQTPPPVTVPPLPLPPPREGQAEREHAAEVLGTALTVLGQVQPGAVTMYLAKAGPTREHERLRQLSTQWMTIQPALIAISVGYPSAGVRELTAAFAQAVSRAVAQPASLFESKDALAEGKPPAEWQEQAAATYTAATQAFDAVTAALHSDDPPGPRPAENWHQLRRTRASTETGKTGTA